jgi:hypothetical protein
MNGRRVFGISEPPPDFKWPGREVGESKFHEVKIDYADENGIWHVDSWESPDENADGKCLGYIIPYCSAFYEKNPDHYYHNEYDSKVWEALVEFHDRMVATACKILEEANGDQLLMAVRLQEESVPAECIQRAADLVNLTEVREADVPPPIAFPVDGVIVKK